jgi:hypothetical protein
MKKILIAISSALVLAACNNTDQGGTVNDGSKDTSTLNSETMHPNDPLTDSSKGEDRVDTWKRDSISKDSIR